jgi:hypothetical protein
MTKTKEKRSMIEFGDWAIGSNVSGWQILKKTVVNGDAVWQSKYFYGSFASCVDALIKKQIRISNYETVKELADNIQNIRSEIFAVLKQNGIESDI